MKKYMSSIIIFSIIIITNLALRPKQTGLVPGSIGNFQENASQAILAYVDLDRDGKIDIVTKSSPLDSVQTKISLNFYVWSKQLKTYNLWSSYPVEQTVKAIYVTSFHVFQNFALVTYALQKDNEAQIQIITFFCKDYKCQFKDKLQIPQLDDVDMIEPSLLTIKGQIGLSFHIHGQANILFFKHNEKIQYNIVLLRNLVLNGQSINNFKYSYNGDYDGDCLTDLILLKTDTSTSQSKTLQFLRGNQKNEYQLVYQAIIQQNILHFTIQDINFDGKNDLILLLQSSKLQIHYHHKHNTGEIAPKLCQGSDLLVSPYDFNLLNTQKINDIQQIQFDKKICSRSLLLFGDFNNDGFDDLTLTFMEGNDPQHLSRSVALLQNIPCHGEECGTYNKAFILQSLTSDIRTFKKIQIGAVGYSYSLSFLDFYQDGNLDIIYHSIRTNTLGQMYSILQPIYNNLDYDAFFLEITILNAKTISSEHNTEYIGGVASFYVTAISGQLQPKTANQLAQTGSILALPSIRLGLGRTNNYLQQLIITVPRNSFSQFRWTPIIPNSQIMIMSAWGESLEWQLKVMIEPTEKLGFVLLIVILSLGVLGIVILRLTKKEKQQDLQTQQKFYTLLK